MKIIVGLGNPGRRYENTRHSLGFRVLDGLAGALACEFKREKHQGLQAQAMVDSEKLLLVKPQTYMNLSGACVAPVTRNAIQSASDLLVVVDDVNLPLGKLRVRAGGSAGGHNGLKSIIERLGTDAFHRLRVGVGDERDGRDLAGHVLAKFHPQERPIVEEAVERAVDAVQCWIRSGVERAMSQYN